MEESVFKSLEVDELSGNYFRTASRWGIFISIVYLVLILLFGLMIFVISAGFSEGFNEGFSEGISRYMPSLEGMNILRVLMIVFVIVGIIFLIVTYFFLTGCLHIKKGISQNNQVVFNSGLKHLKYGLMIYGVLSILGIAFNLINLFR
jgi:heme/copper-type cytochrome/quinol oxidase subunit 2